MTKPMRDPAGVLFDEIATALRFVPGARALHAFGSIPNGTSDAYSDLDFTLVTQDFEASVAQRHQSLAHLRPVLLDWCIERTESSWAGTMLLSGTSPYQKVDIGIVTMEHEREWSGWPDCRKIWDQASGTGSIGNDSRQGQAAYEPPAGSFEHFVIGHLLGVTRYLKARRRGNTFTSWRFAQALAEALLAMAYTSSTDSQWLDRRLTTREYILLDRHVPGDLAAIYFRRLCHADEQDMDESVRFFVGELLARLASEQDTNTVPATVVGTLESFITAELDHLRGEEPG